MKEGPDISVVAALIGNPACANMLMALLAGPALTATELAQEAGLKPLHRERPSRSSWRRPRWSRSSARAATAISAWPIRTWRRRSKALMPVAARAGHLRVRTGPRDPELRRARSCYDHWPAILR